MTRLTMVLALAAALVGSVARAAPFAGSPSASTQTPGATTQCVQRSAVRSIDPEGKTALRFRMTTGVDYVSRLGRSCAFTPGADTIQPQSTVASRMCAGDGLTVTTRGGAGGDVCVLGAFEAVASDHP